MFNTTKATIRYQPGFSVPLIKAASNYAIAVKSIEDSNAGQELGPFYDDIRQNVIATVIMSVSALESNINEFLVDEKSLPELSKQAKVTVVELLESNSILDKYQATLRLGGNEEFNLGNEPFQSTNVLIKLRNAFVHFKPEWSDEQVQHAKLGKLVSGKFQFSPFFLENHITFPDKCMSKGCAQWAVRTVMIFMKEFHEKMGYGFKFGDPFYTDFLDKHQNDT